MSEEEKEARLELNRYIYGKQLTKDEKVEYISILFGYIDKLQKENKELKEEIKNQLGENK